MPTPQLDFVAVGPFKTGTSWIHNYLADYQQVALPAKVKETFFFDRKFDRGEDWYYSHFAQIEKHQKVGEIAPSYFSSAEACARIHQLYPNCKIIVTFREPVARLLSFFQHMQQRGEVEPKISLTEAIEKCQTLPDSGQYYFHLSRWIDTFGSDNVEVIFFEELAKSPSDFSLTLCNKLGLEVESTAKDLGKKVNSSSAPINHNLAKITYSSVNLLHNLGLHKLVDLGKNLGVKQLLSNKNAKKLELSHEEFAAVLSVVKDDVMKLETDLGLDISDWKQTWQERGVKLS
ncbi:MAG: sulfotransferase [Cyanobacteria bacterium J06621_12]